MVYVCILYLVEYLSLKEADWNKVGYNTRQTNIKNADAETTI